MLIASTHRTRSGVTHLRVKQQVFREDLKEKLSRIGSPARWLMAEQAWDCPLNPAAVVRLAEIARVEGEQVEWRDGLREYADQHLKQSDYEHDVRLAIERVIRDNLPIDPYLTLTVKADGTPVPPLRHQGIGYQWAQRVRGLLLAWEMGTGKTRAATDAAGGWYRTGQIPPMQAAVIDGKPAVTGGVLVVCPRTMIQTWQEEVARWQNASAVQIKGTAQAKMRKAGQPAHFHITNYESLKYVMHNKYAGLIVDEVHRCANNTGQTNNVLAIAEGATKKLGLTGTPIANDYKSIFYPMLILDGGRALGPSRTAFLEKFFDASRNMAGFVDYSPHENAGREIAQAISASTYFVKKVDVLDLPPKTHSPIYLPMTDEQKRYYDQVRRDTLVYIQDATVTLEQASARMMKMLQICQGFALTDTTMDGERPGRHFTDAKTEALIEMLTDQLSNQKVIVWAYFQYEIKRLADALKAKGIDCLRIDGTITSQSVRDAQVRRWNTDPSVKVFIRQLSMSEGVTLLGTEDTPCFTSIYLTLNYRMTDLLQSQDRVHRIGQKNRCDYMYLLTENGVDRNVYKRLLSKVEDAELIQTVGKSYYRDLLMEEAA